MAKAKRKELKLPKTVGACADLLFDTREMRLDLQHQAADIKQDEGKIRDHIINTVPKGDTGASGVHHRATVETEVHYGVEDWEAFHGWLLKQKKMALMGLLNRALNEGTLKTMLEEKSLKALPPGVKRFDATVVRLNKI